MTMDHRRTFTVTLDGVDHRVDVLYAALAGWMTIEVDGERRARGWREFQTVFGGARLSCTVGTHRLDARVVQPWAVQSYSFALTVDGLVQPGSDVLPDSRTSIRHTFVQLGWLAGVVALFSTAANGLWPVAALVAVLMGVAGARSRGTGKPSDRG
jgi:hypothetical protein